MHLRATVTYCDALGGVLIVQDATGGISVDITKENITLARGQEIELEGVTAASESQPVIINPTLTVMTGWELLEPTQGRFRSSRRGKRVYKWVEVEGIVRSIALAV